MESDSPIVFASDTDSAGRRALARAAQRGDLVRLVAGVYTSDVGTDRVRVVQRYLWVILGHEMPGALISDRSFADAGSGRDGVVFVVATRDRPLKLPGITVVPRAGAGPVDGDAPLLGGLWLAGEARGPRDNRGLSAGRALSSDWIGSPQSVVRMASTRSVTEPGGLLGNWTERSNWRCSTG
jgi:hypothetical protein